MKVDKIVFSCSLELSPFWNIQSRVWRLGLGIEPVCLLYGKKNQTNVSEEHGQVIEMETLPELPWCLQMVWSKFHHPLTEPDKTWMLGDIDLVPLQRKHFIDDIANVPEGQMLHLNAGGISTQRLGINDGFRQCGCQRTCKDNNAGKGADLPGHYFVAKGKDFDIFTLGHTFEEQVRHIVSTKRYGVGPMNDAPWKVDISPMDAYAYYWCAEEAYASYLLEQAIKSGRIQFTPFFYENGHNQQRIDRSFWNDEMASYNQDNARLQAGQIVDIHCTRPYQKQEAALETIVKLSGILNPL